MNKLLVSLLGFTAVGAGAQEVGRVISSVPVIQQVAVQRPSCTQQPVVVQQPSSGAGGVIGAIAGGLLGNTVGGGSGRAAATAIGIVGGAVVGDRLENRQSVQTVQQCTNQTYYENRAVGYNVTYEYAGRQYTVQLPYDPGPTIPVQVTPLGSGPQYAPPQQPTVTAPPVIQSSVEVVPTYPVVVQQAPTVVYPSYAYPYAPAPYYYRPYRPYPPVSLHIGYVRHSHHRH